MEDNRQSKKGELWGLTGRDIFYKYVRFLPFFVLSVAFCLLAAFAYLRYSNRIYSTTGTLVIEERESKSSDKVEDLITGSNRGSNIQNEIEVLHSRPLMARVVNRLHLQFSYTALGKIKDQNVYKESPFQIGVIKMTDSLQPFSLQLKYADKAHFTIDGSSKKYTYGDTLLRPQGIFVFEQTAFAPSHSGEYVVNWQPTNQLAGSLSYSVKVLPKIPGTTILAVTFQANNPHLAADVVNELMVQYDSMTIEQSNYSTDQMLAFIDARLKILSDELDTLQLKFLRYKQQHNLIDVERQLTDYFTRISESDKEQVALQFKVEQADQISYYLRDKSRQFEQVTPSPLTLEDPTLNTLVAEYNKAQLAREALLESDVPKDNPSVKEVEGQIEKIRIGLVENLRNIKTSYSNTVEGIRKKGGLEESRLHALPFQLKEYVEMERQINTKQELFSLLEGKREEAAISRASTISNSKVLDLAQANLTPSKPNKKAVHLIAILAGIILPALVIFLGEVFNDKVSTRFDIESVTNAPVMGEVGHSFSSDSLVVDKTSRSMVAEQFRIIRSNLQYVLSHNEKPVILVTSSFSGEGKSFVSTNMGAVLALTGKKTVILEFDIRKPKILSGLGMSRKPGISNFLVGKGDLKDLVIPIPNSENLYVLPSGPIPPNPSELLLDSRINDMFSWLRDNFEVIIIDTAPVGMVSDAMTLGKFANCTLYLVRQGHTMKKQVLLIDELYKESKLPKVSVIINDVKLKPGYGYYGYGRYGYGYGQKSSGYYEEEQGSGGWLAKLLSKFDIKRIFKGKKK